MTDNNELSVYLWFSVYFYVDQATRSSRDRVHAFSIHPRPTSVSILYLL